MQRLVTILAYFILAWNLVAQDYDLIYFGDNRPHLPGPEKISMVFAINPALSADTVHNSLSYSFCFLPPLAAAETDGLLPAGTGQYLAVAMPNFCLMNLSQSSTMLAVNKSEYQLTKDLLGLQFGLSLKDFMATELLNVSSGLGLYRLRNLTTSGQYGGPAESINLDLGFVFSFSVLNLEFLIRDLWVYTEAGGGFGSKTNYYGSLGGKVILDIEYKLGFATAKDYPAMEFAGELAFVRYFFSNALRTGISLKSFFDLDSATNKLPVVLYNLAVSYTPTELLPASTQQVKAGDLPGRVRSIFYSLLYNLAFQAAGEIVISNLPGQQNIKPIFTLGLVKSF